MARAVAVVTVTGFIGGAVSVSLASSAAAACAAGQLAGPSRVGRFAGIVHPVRMSASCTPKAAGDPAKGTPPLIFHNGAVMSTPKTGDKVVITPIYWGTFAGKYEKVINRYLADAAADSEKTTNVYSTLFEYYGTNGAINYHFKRGAPINDANAFPASGCTVNTGSVYSDGSGYTSCLDDAQVTAEIRSVVAANSLRADLGHMYVIFLPKHVESCFYPGNPANQACTINPTPSAAYCAYHSSTGTGGKTIYGNMPFPVYASATGYTCGSDARFPTNEAPNGNVDADVEISPTSHEVAEAITDPDTSTGWYDSSGYENGDECAYVYGTATGTAGALYNQTINGRHYLTQEEFSNADFAATSGAGGCLQHANSTVPAITSVSPNSGPVAGGTSVTITGTGFPGATSVTFGGAAATFTITDATHIAATAPAHAAGTVDVRVQTSAGTSPVVATDHFTYS